jgi:hypothetical protein
MTKKKLKGVYDELGRYLCNDFSEYDRIIKQLLEAKEKQPDGMLDFIDDIVVWEKVEMNFTVGEFCEHIGI